MTPSEFKAWFEGFTEGMDGPPSLKQWERIRARVTQITGQPTTYLVYVDRYLTGGPYWRNPIYPYGVCTSAVSNLQNTAAAPAIPNDVVTMQIGGTGLGPDGHMAKFSQGDGGTVFDSHAAMSILGKADAAELASA